MPPSCPLCEAPVPPEVEAGPPEAVFTCSGCYISLTWKNGAALPTPRPSAPLGSAPVRPSSPFLSPLAGLPSAPRTNTGPIPRARGGAPEPEWGGDSTALDRPRPAPGTMPLPRSRSTEQVPAPQWNDATSVEPAVPESTLVEVPAVPTAPPPSPGYPSWLEETNVRTPGDGAPAVAAWDAPAPPARIPPGTQALFAPFSLPQAPGGLDLPRAPRATTGAFPAAKPSTPPRTEGRGAGAFPAASVPGPRDPASAPTIPSGRPTTGAFPAARAPELKPLPRGTTGQFQAVSSDLPALPRAPTGAFPAVAPRPSAPTMPVAAVQRETPRASAPTTPFVPQSSPPQAATMRVPSYGELGAVDTTPSPKGPRAIGEAIVVADGTVDSPELMDSDTAMSPALFSRPAAPKSSSSAIGRIGLVKQAAPSAPSEVTQATSPSLMPLDDAPVTQTRDALPAVDEAPRDTNDGLSPLDDEPLPAPSKTLAMDDAPEPPHPAMVTEVRGTPPVAPPRRAAPKSDLKLILALGIPLGVVVVGGGGFLLWSRFKQPSVVEIPLPPEPPKKPVVVAPPEPTPPPPEPPPPTPAPPPEVKKLFDKPIVQESDPATGAAAKARAQTKKGDAKLAKDKKGALAAYRAALKLYPGYVPAYRGYAAALAATNDKKGAIKQYKIYIANAPEADAEAAKKALERLEKPAKKKK